jgi:diguanylate cyclase (GGDEF)-like protein/PAS domain S-box-containing protein
MYRILGEDPEHFVPTRGALLDTVADVDRARLNDEVDAAIRERGSFDTFFTISRPEGERREVRLRGTVVTAPGPQAGHVLGICQDLTDLRRAQADLVAAVQLSRRTFDDAPVGMALVDREGRYQQVNDALCAFLGRSREELLSLSLMDLTDREDVAESRAMLARLASGEVAGSVVEKRYLRSDGSRVWGALRASVIRDPEGQVAHGLAVIEDVTERRRAELRRATLHAAASVMAEGGSLDTALPALAAAIAATLGWGPGTVRLVEAGEPAPEPSRSAGFPLRSGRDVVGLMEFEGAGADGEELAALTEVLGAQIGEFVVRKRAEEQLSHLALHDPLTGLPNRVLFFDRLDQAIRRAQRAPAPLAVLFLDFDGFKTVNDRFGHAGGDEVLCSAAERVAAALRANDTVARFGGDELVILSEHLASREAPELIAQRVLAQLATPIEIEGEHVALTASIGVCIATEPGATRDELLRVADAAMYRAKAAGPGRYVIAE